MVDYFRKENNLTMEELGIRLGKTKSTISRWISGERSPKMEEVEQLAELFNTDIETLIFGTNSSNITIEKIYNQLSPPRQQKVYDFAESQLMEQKREDKLSSFDERTLQNLQRYAEEFGIDALDSLFEEMLSDTGKNDSTNHEAG